MKDSVNILFVCGYGVGSSLMMQMVVGPVIKKKGIKAEMQVTAAGEAGGLIEWADIIGISEKMEEGLSIDKDIPVIRVKNLVEGETISEQILAVVKERYPFALQQ